MNRSLHVLLIEDSEDDAELLIYELDRNGYSLIHERVETASAMQAALEKKPWDIIIADYNLPSFSAPAALDLLQKTGVDLPFIIVSGKIGEETAIEALKAGAHDYLMKGKLGRLVPAIERELRDAEERRKRRLAEQTIRQNEERFRLLIENALDIIMLLRNDGIICYASPSVERVLGYQPSHLVGKNILDYIHQEDAEFFLNSLNQIVHTPNTKLSTEFRLKDKNNSWRIIEAIGQTFLNPSEQQSIVINSRDITERKQAEEIRSALEQERQLSEERFQFISMMSHEFRNPLSTILASIQLLKTYGDNTPKDKKYRCIYRIESTTKQLTQMLSDVLNISRAELGKVKVEHQLVDLADFCELLVEEIQLAHNNPDIIDFSIQGECHSVTLDKNLLKHILTNLLSNAIKYSVQQSKVTFDVRCEHGKAFFRIQDRGIGITLDDQQRLFEPFHRGENARQIPGTGLGLCIVKKYVELQGGEISLDSEVGVGTTVTVTLPLNLQSPSC